MVQAIIREKETRILKDILYGPLTTMQRSDRILMSASIATLHVYVSVLLCVLMSM